MGESHMKGYLYTLEVLIAIAIVFGTIAFIFRSPYGKPDIELVTIKQQGFDALKYLDEKGELNKYAFQNNETAIESLLDSVLAKSVRFEAEICKTVCDNTGVPEDQTVMVVDYYTSGYRENYENRKVRLYLWKSY